ncbi:DUF202 domain-containing protein [Nocardioides allogilvus]|uniref:DUF202 domain-containing protein n=1 Tax=Nocardioides allogilvus TaxID=2072017 RepID=UPI000D30F82F|nr:DUF202 domain-containing protein [Nocardioides allogilvus]
MGLSDESHALDRTLLAWWRTALALVTGAAVAARLRFPDLDPLVFLVAVGLTTLGFVLTFGVLARDDPDARRDGRAAALVVLATATVAVAELALLVAGP